MTTVPDPDPTAGETDEPGSDVPVGATGSEPAVRREPDRPRGEAWARRHRRGLLIAGIARYLVPILAIPLAPVLFPDQMVLLTLLRPGKEVLLAVGGLYRTNADGTPDLLLVFLAYLPLMVGAVWAFFWLGRAWQDELEADEGPEWLNRVIPPETFARLRRLLEERGPAFAFIGRVMALPPTIMAAAAGTSEVDTRRYLVADFLGAIASFAVTVYAGWWLGEAYERGGWWFLGLAVAGLFVLVAWGTAWLNREPEPEPDPDA